MRTFLAIDIPTPIQEKLAKQLSELKEDYQQFSWVSPENFHITLQFFGEVENIEKLKKKIETAVYDIPAFHMFSQGADVFIHHKIVLHVLFQRQKIVEELVERVRNAVGQVEHYSQQYKFVPHVTIARSKIPSKQQYFHLKKKLERMDIDIDFPVNKIFLYQSILESQAPVYKKLVEFPLVLE